MVSVYRSLVALADKLGTGKKTTIRRKTEEGTVTLTVQGKLALSADEFANQAAAMGAKLANKSDSGFDQADVSGGCNLDGKSARVVAESLCHGVKPAAVKPEEDGDEDDTPIDAKSAGATA